MRSGLWGHALFLASKMDSRAYNTVLSRCVSLHNLVYHSFCTPRHLLNLITVWYQTFLMRASQSFLIHTCSNKMGLTRGHASPLCQRSNHKYVAKHVDILLPSSCHHKLDYRGQHCWRSENVNLHLQFHFKWFLLIACPLPKRSEYKGPEYYRSKLHNETHILTIFL